MKKQLFKNGVGILTGIGRREALERLRARDPKEFEKYQKAVKRKGRT